MELIEFMPTRFGQQFYPGGTPIDAEAILIMDEASEIDLSIREMYCKHGIRVKNPKISEFLKGYLLYYMNAPCWDIDDDRNWSDLSLPQLLDICFEWGLDPF